MFSVTLLDVRTGVISSHCRENCIEEKYVEKMLIKYGAILSLSARNHLISILEMNFFYIKVNIIEHVTQWSSFA